MLSPAQKYYYHPAMKVSWPIKASLPAISEGSLDLDYRQSDEMRDGLSAQATYLEITRSDTSKER
jgi:hypothetical protein